MISDIKFRLWQLIRSILRTCTWYLCAFILISGTNGCANSLVLNELGTFDKQVSYKVRLFQVVLATPNALKLDGHCTSGCRERFGKACVELTEYWGVFECILKCQEAIFTAECKQDSLCQIRYCNLLRTRLL